MTYSPVSLLEPPTPTFLWNLLNHLPSAILVKNRQHDWAFYNPAFHQLIGWDGQGLPPSLENPESLERDEQVFLTGEPLETEEWWTDAQGQQVAIAIHRSLLPDPNHEPWLVCSLRPCVSNQCHVDPEVLHREATHRALVEALPDLLIRMRSDGVYLDFSFKGEFKPPAIQAESDRSIYDVLPHHVAQQRIAAAERALTTQQLQVYEQELVIDGKTVYEEVRLVPSGPDEVLTMIRDVTDRKYTEMALHQLNEDLEHKVEERTQQLKQVVTQLQQEIRDRKQAKVQLQEQEAFLRSIYEGIEHQMFVINVLEDGAFQYGGWNGYTERELGIASADAVGKTPEEIFGPKEGATVRQRYRHCVESLATVRYEECLTFKGQKKWSITTLNPLQNETGRVYRIIGTTFDITDRKRTEAQLQQQSKAIEDTLRELQRTQTQLVQSEKMSGLGQLVAGVAHEINNPVNFIFGNLKHADLYTQDLLGLVQLYQDHYPNPVPAIQAEAEAIDLEFLMDDLPKLLKSMKVGAERIQKIVASLRTFSRMDEAEMKSVDLSECIDSTLMILQHRLKAKSDHARIEITKAYEHLPLIECYAGQLNQVFMNVLSNAIDALEESAIKRSDFKPMIAIHLGLVEGPRVAIQIRDNGPGIPEAVRARIFDPFFTTKPIGKGTGMGLSISYQIVTEKHGGRLSCESTPGEGTTFVIEIPLNQGGT